jgi:hypothetical protein
MANDNYPELEWHYSVEIQSDFKGLAVLKQDVRDWMERRGQPGHEVEVAQPATLVVRFQSYQMAQFFYFNFNGRFVYLNDNKPKA